MKRVLILDDESDLEFIFRALLSDEITTGALELDYFSNPVLCLEHFRKRQPAYDFILCDINMPDLSGVEFVRQLRHIGYRGQIFFMSAYRQDDYQADMEMLDIPLFISKPLDFGLLRNLIARGLPRVSTDSDNQSASQLQA